MMNEKTSPYAKPHSVLDALALIGNDSVCVLAGGTDFVIMRSEGIIQPNYIVDIKGIESLRHIRVDSNILDIGACVSLDDLSRNAPFAPNAISDGAALVGSWQTRARATIGGNICRASPAADTLCGLLVLRSQFELASARGARLVSATDFFVGPGRSLLRSDELLTRIIVPQSTGGSAYQRFTYRNAMDLSVAGLAIFLEVNGDRCTDAQVAIGACGPKPILVPNAAKALIGSNLDKVAIDAAANEVVAVATPIDDVRGTRKHRLHVLRPLTHRVTRQALERAMEAQT